MQTNFNISPSSTHDNLDKAMNEVWESVNDNPGLPQKSLRNGASPSSLAVSGVLAASFLSPSLSWLHYDLSSYAFADYQQSLSHIKIPSLGQSFELPGIAFEPFSPKKITKVKAVVANISSYKPVFEG